MRLCEEKIQVEKKFEQELSDHQKRANDLLLSQVSSQHMLHGGRFGSLLGQHL